MPTVFREDGLRYFFFSNEGSPREPAHIHVIGRGCDAKVWLEPEIAIADSYGFNARE
jgi:diadenosine tetraphosphate (Ap4A) HIT family hydrolase